MIGPSDRWAELEARIGRIEKRCCGQDFQRVDTPRVSQGSGIQAPPLRYFQYGQPPAASAVATGTQMPINNSRGGGSAGGGLPVQPPWH